MNTHSMQTKSADSIPVKWVLGSLALATLYFQPTLADPFNSPKLWVLLFFSAWLTGYIYSFKNVILTIKPIKHLSYLVLAFLSSLLLSSIFTDFRYLAIFGDTQRRNGFLQYLSLGVILIATSIFIRVFNVYKLIRVTYFIASISILYALMQTTGNDFINWNNPYNAVISTVGNPNFAAAVMAVMGVITFMSIFIKSFSYTQRFSAGVITTLLLFVIYKSNARQGLLAYSLGAGIFLLLWLRTKKKTLWIWATASSLFIFVISVLGMLQIGPLEKYLYKPSVSIRGYYWRAGIEMFTSHPLLGVGIDSYGLYFKEYREVQYPLIYGFEITSTNAHNTFIQFFATGGIFLGITYLLLNGYILIRAIKGIKNLRGDGQILLAGVFSAWVAFHAQSLISIDNIGISIWGWVLGGAIIGMSVPASAVTNDKSLYVQRKRNSIDLKQPLTSSILTILVLVLVAILYRGEINSLKGSESINFQDPAARGYFKELQLKVINTPLNDPTYKLIAASRLIQGGFIDDGLLEAKKLYLQNPRNLDLLNLFALTYEQSNDLTEANIYRGMIAQLDPWNAANYLALGKNYKALGNTTNSEAMLMKILSFASSHSIAEQARKELA